MFTRPRCRLQVLKGDAQGREIAVSHSPFLIGSDPQCAWVLAEASVRPQHAVLEREGEEGPWTLRNLGPRGVLVNQQPISSTLLSDGDTIQFGAATLVSFHAPEAASPQPAGAGAAPAVNPVLLAVFGVVVALSLAFLVLAPRPGSKDASDPDALTPELMASLLQGTRDCLLGDELLEGYQPMTHVAASEPAARFYVLIALRQRGAEAARKAEVASQQVLDSIQRQLTQAWLLESQGRLGEARQTYGRIAETVPDLRCPATRYAAFRQAGLGEQIAARRQRS